jgi:hypothetical protein
MVAQVQRTEQLNKVSCGFTGNGVYSHSAYHTQFIGTFADHEWYRLWKSKAENKCKFFSWLLLQNRLWTTADRIVRHGEQTNTICQLCRTHLESAIHIMVQCPFTQQLWLEVASWMEITAQPLPLANHQKLKTWWNAKATGSFLDGGSLKKS